jgi:DnaJ like chaperone protein
MSWWGSAGGAVVGGMLGGPIGGVVGAYAGHALASWFTTSSQSEGILRMAGAIYRGLAKADGEISPREQQRIEQFLNEDNTSLQPSVDADTLRKIVHTTSQDEKRLQDALQILPQNPELAAIFLRRCFRLAAADLVISDAELQWLAAFAQQIGISEDDFSLMMLLFYRTNESNAVKEAAYDVLKVPRDASPQRITEAYRDLARKYHPDVHRDLSPELKELTSKKFSEVTHAYEALTNPEKWWGRHPGSGDAQYFSDRETTQCFCCQRKVRLPPAEHHWSARCPECQVLLLYPEEIAGQFASAAAENTKETADTAPNGSHRGKCPHCGKGYVAVASNLGNDIRCLACKKTFVMSGSS